MTKQELLFYLKEEYKTEPEYLWKGDPDSAALRHSENEKWYGVLMRVRYDKLGIERDGMVDILDLKCDKDEIALVRGIDGVYPGYHMNKAHWITVLLDGSTEDGLIKNLIEESYGLTLSKKKRKRKG